MRKNKLTLAVLAILAFVLVTVQSCKKEENWLDEGLTTETYSDDDNGYGGNRSSSEGMIVLGNVLNDPYKFENMLMARNQLAHERSGITTPMISATHMYMRYKPVNEEELDLLKADTNLLLWDYPLHYDIAVAGTYYHDPSIVDSLPTWQYFVVPNDYQFPVLSSKCELIYTLYFPEENSSDSFYDDLEERAYLITGNLQDGEVIRAEKWIPSAVIKAYDDVARQYIPLQGVKVIAKNFTKSKYGITDANGYCRVNGTFKTKVTYSIKWERSYWDIRDGLWGQAYTNGPNISNQWICNIPSGGKSLMFATIHRAANKAYYGYFGNLRRPTLNVGKTKLCYIHGSSSNGYLGMAYSVWNVFGVIPNIKIWGYNSTTYRKTNEIFGTTIHELTHLSHLRFMGNLQFYGVNNFVAESWARCVQCILTNQHYNQELALNSSCLTHNELNSVQSWTPNYENPFPYTPIYIDLIDNYNQFTLNSAYINDNISGYTLSEIQNLILPDSFGMTSTRSAIKANKRHGATDSQIDNLFIKYEGLGF